MGLPLQRVWMGGFWGGVFVGFGLLWPRTPQDRPRSPWWPDQCRKTQPSQANNAKPPQQTEAETKYVRSF